MKNCRYFLLSSLLFLSGCFKLEETTEENYNSYVPDGYALDWEGVREWFFFPEGSWWVLKNVETNERDSSYCFSLYQDLELDMFEGVVYNNVIYHADLNYARRVFAIKEDYERFPIFSQVETRAVYETVIDFNEYDYSILFVAPLIKGMTRELTSGKSTVLAIDEPYTTASGQTFNTVVIEYQGNQSQQNTIRIHFSKNIGIVSKHNLSTNEHWELTNFFVPK